VLCDFADDGGRNCWPSIATIASKASLSERQTQRVMVELKQQQLIAVTGNTAIGGRGTSCRYVINVQKLAVMASDARLKRELALAQKGDNLSPFPVVDNCLKGDMDVTLSEPERVTFETERVTSTTLKGDMDVTQSVINHQQAVRDARERDPVDNLNGSLAPESSGGETLQLFPVDWQPCDVCRSILQTRKIEWPAQHVVDAFAAHKAGTWIAPRRIPNEFVKWVCRQRGMDARVAADPPSKKSVSDDALRAWQEVRTANQRERMPDRGWTDPRTKNALEAIGGFNRLRDMRTSDVSFREREFITAFSKVRPAP
jgi:Helix-turn-helix domain